MPQGSRDRARHLASGDGSGTLARPQPGRCTTRNPFLTWCWSRLAGCQHIAHRRAAVAVSPKLRRGWHPTIMPLNVAVQMTQPLAFCGGFTFALLLERTSRALPLLLHPDASLATVRFPPRGAADRRARCRREIQSSRAVGSSGAPPEDRRSTYPSFGSLYAPFVTMFREGGGAAGRIRCAVNRVPAPDDLRSNMRGW